jgi:CrcB protein
MVWKVRMMTMIKCLIVGAGGAIGAIGRYLIGLLPMNPENGFPLKTFLINVIGCFIIGIIAALADKNAVNPNLVLLIKVGICGGFTTFSSFALETEGLIAKGSTGVALMYVILSLVCGVLAVFAAEKMIGNI